MLNYVKEKTVLPIYFVGATWIIWVLFLPLYRPTHFIMAALVSAIAYYVGKMIFPDRGYSMGEAAATPEAPKAQPAAAKDETPKEALSPEIQQLLQERDRAVGELKRLNDAIENPVISAKIDRMEATTKKIIDAVVEKPAKLPQIRKFLNYYLPTTLKLLNAYDRMDDTGISGENIDGTKGKIEDMLDTVCTAFDRQLDALYGEEALDISTDITVMENLLAQEGLTGLQMGSPS